MWAVPVEVLSGSPYRLLDPKAWSSSPWEKKLDLRSVTFVDGERGWIVGNLGTILHTADGGRTWTVQETPVDQELRGVDFIDAKHGWAVGGGNGMDRKGADKVARDPSETIPLKGGKIDLREALKKARAKRKNWSIVLRTEDGGKTWEKVQLDSNFPLWGVAMTAGNRGWITSGHAKEHPDGHFRFTLDGGKTWKSPSGPFCRPARPLYDVAFLDESTGWAVGSHRLIGLRGEGVKDIVLYREGKGGVIHTRDGGKTWEVQDPGNPKDIYLLGVCFAGRKHGWVVGEKGSIYASSDGGGKWRRQKSGVAASLYAVDFLDEKRGLAAGQDGTLLATVNGGRSWKAVKVEVKEDLLDVEFAGESLALVVGADGVILRFGPEK
jgi:photosystem II stability/assembly factor-like uncharacterized protein